MINSYTMMNTQQQQGVIDHFKLTALHNNILPPPDEFIHGFLTNPAQAKVASVDYYQIAITVGKIICAVGQVVCPIVNSQ
jgi:hypothetical protein